MLHAIMKMLQISKQLIPESDYFNNFVGDILQMSIKFRQLHHFLRNILLQIFDYYRIKLTAALVIWIVQGDTL